jgi:hypothetical protein
MAETLTVLRLEVPPALARTLRSTNTIESMIGICREHSKNVKRWRDGTMALRWCAAGMTEAGKQFRRVNGHLHLPRLRAALEACFTENVSAACEDESATAKPDDQRGRHPKFNETRDNLQWPAGREQWPSGVQDVVSQQRRPGHWYVLVMGVAASNGYGDSIGASQDGRIARAFRPPLSFAHVHTAGFPDDAGFCEDCNAPTAPGTGTCPNPGTVTAPATTARAWTRTGPL